MKAQNNLAQLRTKRGISAAQLASAIGASRQAIYAIRDLYAQCLGGSEAR